MFFFIVFFYGFWRPDGPILAPFWAPFGLNFRWFFQSNNQLIFQSIFGRLLDGFWVPRPSKIELSCKRNAHFQKITFFVPEVVFDAKWNPTSLQNGAKKLLKIDQKSDAFFHWKKYRFLMENGSQGEPKGTPKGPQNQGIRRTFRAFSPAPPQRG